MHTKYIKTVSDAYRQFYGKPKWSRIPYKRLKYELRIRATKTDVSLR